eukprot:917125-Pelagomonas_calceolata.AAC.2
MFLGVKIGPRVEPWAFLGSHQDARPTQGIPCPETLAILPNKKFRQPCSVRRLWEAVAGAVEKFGRSLAGSLGPGPASPSAALKLGKPAKHNFLSGQPNFGLGCSGQSVEAKIPKVKIFTFPARPLQTPGTAPEDTNTISILMRMTLLGPGPGGARSGDFAIHLRTIPACR